MDHSENDFIRKMEATSNEQTLVVLDSDFLTFNLYNLKKQERFKTLEYKNDLRRLDVIEWMSRKSSLSLCPLGMNI